MRSIFCLALTSILAFQASAVTAAERVLRETGLSPAQLLPLHDRPYQIDEVDTLRYERPGNPPYFTWLPDEFGDDYLNVRFTPSFEPYFIVGVLIPFFDMENIQGGPAGTPGVTISVWESGFQDDSSGFPTDRVASLDFPYADEQNDSVLITFCPANSLIWNFLDLRPLKIGPIHNRDDFHIAVSILADQETDTLAIFHDDGRGQYRTDRSGLLNGLDSTWWKMKYLPGITRGLNFYMHAVISDTIPWSVGSQNDFAPPSTILLNPAYPNPFNNRTSLGFTVPNASPYQVQLLDRQGRQVRLLGEGTGGSGVLALDAASLSTGTYFVTLKTPNGVVTQPIHLIR